MADQRCRLPTVLALLGFFLSVDLRVREDGSGKMLIRYPASPISNAALERARFTSAASEATGVRIQDGVVSVRVGFKDLTRLNEAPELQNSTVRIERDGDGTERLRAMLRATVAPAPNVTVGSDRDARVRLTLPWPIVTSNATEANGRTAVWAGPIGRFFTAGGIPVEADYRRSVGAARTAVASPLS